MNDLVKWNRESRSRPTLITDKAIKATEERWITFQINVAKTTGYSCVKDMNPGTDLVPFLKMKSNGSQMKISSLELPDDVDPSLDDLGCADDSLAIVLRS